MGKKKSQRAHSQNPLLVGVKSPVQNLDALLQSEKPTAAQPAPHYRPAAPLIVLVMSSIAVGVYVTYQALHAPGYYFPRVKGLSGRTFQQRQGVDYGWYEPLKPLFFRVDFLHHVYQDRFAQGLLVMLYTNAMMPMLESQLIDALKAGRSQLLSSLVVVGVSVAKSTTFTTASAMLLFWVPLYALSRYRESSLHPQPVHPLPSPSERHVRVAQWIQAAFLAPLIFCGGTRLIFWQMWVRGCILLILAPLILVPLALLTPSQQELRHVEGVVQPRLGAARAYRSRILTIIRTYYWWRFLYVARPGLRILWQHNKFTNDGGHIMFWDLWGTLIAQYLLVLVDVHADAARIFNMGIPRPRRSFIKEQLHAFYQPDDETRERTFLDDLVSVPGLLILGPGYTISRYYARREEMAEKARIAASETSGL